VSEPYVIGVTATYRRPAEIERLLASLDGVHGIVVCDNSADPAVRDAVARAPVPSHYLAPGENLGCGGGLRLAEEHAWKIGGDRLTHVLVLDDDAVLLPGAISKLCTALDREHADVAYPLVIGPEGHTGWMPGLLEPALHRLGHHPMEPTEYVEKLGSGTHEFSWAQGICLLARKEAVDRAGFHRPDFWVRGEDLDFSLRLTQRGRGIFVPGVRVRHLPPPANAAELSSEREYLRHTAMVQNIAYLAFRQDHGARIRNSVAGASRRFVAAWGARALADLLRALWRGAVLAETAGTGAGRTFRKRFDELR
jgi:GT2 family glycosyltransferase